MPTIIDRSNEYVLTKAQFDQLEREGQLVIGAVYHITDYAIASNGEEVLSGLPNVTSGQSGQYIKVGVNGDKNAYIFGTVDEELSKTSENPVTSGTLADILEEKNKEIKKLKFKVANLKNIAYDAIVEDLPHKFEDLDIDSHPTHIADESGQYHPVLPNGECEFVSMEGKSVKYNQLIQKGVFDTTSGWTAYNANNVSLSVSNNKLIVKSKYNGVGGDASMVYASPKIPVIGNKYLVLVRAGINVGSEIIGYSYEGYSRVVYLSQIVGDLYGVIITADLNQNKYYLKARGNIAINDEWWFSKPQLVNLTTIYGAGSEPTTVEQFLAGYPAYNNYVPYTEGSIKSVLAEGVQINGQNLWDEEWEVGWIDPSGVIHNDGTCIHSKNFTEVIPNKTYKITLSNLVRACYYDSNKRFISRTQNAVSTFTPPSDCKYIKLTMGTTYGVTYLHDIAIILGTQGSYTPYKEPLYISFGNEPIELKGVGTANDRIDLRQKDDLTYQLVKVQTMGEVDLGTLNYIYSSDYGYFKTPNIYNIKTTSEMSTIPNILLSNYQVKPQTTWNSNKPCAFMITGDSSVSFGDDRFTDVSLFKENMIGNVLYYELEEPVETVLADNLTEPQVATLIEQYGSIEVVGNTNEEFVKPDVTMMYQCAIATDIPSQS